MSSTGTTTVLDVRGYRQHQIRRALERYDSRTRPWFQAAISEERPTWTEVYLAFTTGLPNVTASLPVYDSQGSQLLGVCAADVVLPEEFRNFLSQLNVGESGHAFVVDRQGNLISSSTDEPLMLEVGNTMAFFCRPPTAAIPWCGMQQPISIGNLAALTASIPPNASV
jgi:adenylate cyclase